MTEFAYYSAGGGKRRWRCKRCVGEAVTRRKQHIRRVLIAEAGGRCAICGYARCPINLSFHHVDPAQKSFPLSSDSTKSIAEYLEEAKKCVLLCSNCHGEVEMGLVPSPPPMATYATFGALPPAERLGATERGGHEPDDERGQEQEGEGDQDYRRAHEAPRALQLALLG